MTAPVFNLAAAQAATPNWPPYDGDVWADRHGTRWVTHRYEVNDEVRTAFLALDSQSRITPDYLLEKAGPLRLLSAGWERARDTQAVAA